ncbi:MAG: CRISPR-associated endonuclease Cas2 [Cyanobacteria bacterium J06576_12]
MAHLICYDITNNSLRTKLGKRILRAGLDRINKSVYLGTIGAGSLQLLEKDLASYLQQKPHPSDSLIVISVGSQQIQQMRVYGQNDLDRDELTGAKSTLIV